MRVPERVAECVGRWRVCRQEQNIKLQRRCDAAAVEAAAAELSWLGAQRELRVVLPATAEDEATGEGDGGGEDGGAGLTHPTQLLVVSQPSCGLSACVV